MAKVVLLVNVELENGKREAYLSAVGTLRDRFRSGGDVDYCVFENQGKDKDSFTEMFTFKDMASYEVFDEGEEETDANEIFAKILAMGKRAPRYTTLLEIE